MPRAVYFPAPLSLSIQPARCAAFLEAYGCSPSLIDVARAGGSVLARTLFTQAFDDAPADALDLVVRLGNAAGKHALLEASRACAVSLGDASSLTPVDLAADALTRCARETEGQTKRVVRRALLWLAEIAEPVFAYEYVAREPRRARSEADVQKDLAAFAGGRSTWSDVWWHEDERGAFHAAILTADDPESVVDVDPALGPQARTRTPLRFDRLDVDPAGGRMAVHTLHSEDVHALVALTGRAFFGDAKFFSTDRPAFTTRVLEVLGSAGIAQLRLPAPITRMRVIACTKELIGVGRQIATGSAALALQEHGPQVAGGYFPDMTLRFDIAGEEIPVDVDICLPGRFACSVPRWAPLLRDVMKGIGMMSPGTLADDAWSLFPFRRPDWRLREALGSAALDALLAQNAFKRVVSRNVTIAALRAQGSNFLTFPVPGEPAISYAIPSDPSTATRDVTEEDREVLELDIARLAAIRAREMKLEGESRVRADGASVIHGLLRTPVTSLAFASVLRAPAGVAEREALVKDLAKEVFPAHLVLLVPRGRAWGGAPFEIEFDGLVEGGLSLVERAIALAHLEDAIEPCRLTDAPLVVHRKTRRVWFYETLIDLPDSGYAMIEGLASRPDEVCSLREVCKWISPAREDLQAARATRPKIVKWMTASFEGVGKEVPAEEIERVVVVEGKKGYRIGVGVRVF